MTIDEAIDRLRELHGELIREERLEKADSVRLGIEALRRIQEYRTGVVWIHKPLLPGETN